MTGKHTWEIIIQYHECPHCGYVFESRTKWARQGKEETKNLTCPRCKKDFTLTRKYTGPIGPLFGEPPKPEFDWNGTV
jgi:hypothetical protein